MIKKNVSYSICLLAILLFGFTVNTHAEPLDESKIQLQLPAQFNIQSSPKADQSPPYIEGEVIVTLRPSAKKQTAGKAFGRTTLHVKKVLKQRVKNNEKQCLLIKSKDGKTTQEMIEELKKDPAVISAEPNYKVYLKKKIPNDPDFGELWGLNNTGQSVDGISGTAGCDISAPAAWDVNTGSSDVVVAVLDSGVLYTHPDLAPNMWQNPAETVNGNDDDGNGYIDDVFGIDTIDADSDPIDDNGHGTHVAGIIGARGNDGYGITGVNWDVKIMAVRSAAWDVAPVIEGINYIVEMKRDFGINIVAINASYGRCQAEGVCDPPIQAEQDAIERAQTEGILFVASAGNESNNNDSTATSYPASYPLDNIISVAATNQDDALTFFSNYGATSVDLAAPGNNIYSTYITDREDRILGALFSDDLESGGGNWETGGTNNDWTIAEWTSGDSALKTNSAPQYQNNSESYVIIKNAIDLSGTNDPYLEFWLKGSLEEDIDGLFILFSADDGSTWSAVSAVTGPYGDWEYIEIAIPPVFRTTNFKFSFVLLTDESVTDEGYFIDDVWVGDYALPGPSYDYNAGTSMAAPHVTGAVALLAAQYPDDTAAQRKARILNNVDKLASLGGKVSTGGRLNLEQAISDSCMQDADCDDGLYCNGDEACSAGACVAGVDPCVAGETCNEGTDQCIPDADCEVDDDCSDGLYCNGDETCSAGECVAGVDPCIVGEICNEGTNQCIPDAECVIDDDCSDGLYCNGDETCSAGECVAGVDPCEADESCDEELDQCFCDVDWDLDGDCDVDKKDKRILRLFHKAEKKAQKALHKAQKVAIKSAYCYQCCGAEWDLNDDCYVDKEDKRVLKLWQKAEKTDLKALHKYEKAAMKAALQ